MSPVAEKRTSARKALGAESTCGRRSRTSVRPKGPAPRGGRCNRTGRSVTAIPPRSRALTRAPLSAIRRDLSIAIFDRRHVHRPRGDRGARPPDAPPPPPSRPPHPFPLGDLPRRGRRQSRHRSPPGVADVAAERGELETTARLEGAAPPTIAPRSSRGSSSRSRQCCTIASRSGPRATRSRALGPPASRRRGDEPPTAIAFARAERRRQAQRVSG
jgi:hypothetical protein